MEESLTPLNGLIGGAVETTQPCPSARMQEIPAETQTSSVRL